MAHPHGSESQPADPCAVAAEACRGDDVSLMSQAVLAAQQYESNERMTDFMTKTLKLAVQSGSARVLSYLFDVGADVKTLQSYDIAGANKDDYPSEEILDILLMHGWDINARDTLSPLSFIWLVLESHGLVVWSVTHGAKTYQTGDALPGDLRHQSLLETATYCATPATFELLRSNGAPFSPRTLHVAVQYAARASPYYGTPPDADFRRCMDMVQHLVGVLKVDVNADERCLKELVWYLLDHGLDPNRPYELYDQDISALQYGIQQGNDRFVAAIQEWQVRRGKTP